MFEWKVEKMKLINEHNDVCSDIKRHKITLYTCENSVSREDKIDFIDSMQDGKMSYLLSLIEKFNVDKENLPKKESVFGETEVKTTSLKSWIKRNDTKYQQKIIDDWYEYGTYNLLDCKRNIQSNRKGDYDYYEDLVDEIFRRQLMECEDEERKYFREHDEYEILKQKFREKHYDTTFGVHISDWSSGELCISDGNDDYENRKEREITIEELKELLSKYAQLDALVDKLTAETHIEY